MNDETNPELEKVETWVMPKPIFRSSEGHRPKALADSQEDIPTEPGFSDDETEEDIVLNTTPPDPDGAESAQSVRATTKTRVRHQKKRSGCAKAFGLVAGAIALSIFAIIAVVVYFLVFYKPAGTSF